MDSSIGMALNSQENRNELSYVFPDLRDDVNFEILSPETPVYNCIAWAMRFDDRWVDVEVGPGCWWPDGVERSMSPNALVHAFEAVGFVVCDDEHFEEEFNKVVLYKNERTNQWTHAARVVSESKEHSKFGQSWDGTHSHDVLSRTAQGCESLSYGVAYAFMKRSISYKMPPLKQFGNIAVNMDLLKALLGM